MMDMLHDMMQIVLKEMPYAFTPRQEMRFKGILDRLDRLIDKERALFTRRIEKEPGPESV